MMYTCQSARLLPSWITALPGAACAHQATRRPPPEGVAGADQRIRPRLPALQHPLIRRHTFLQRRSCLRVRLLGHCSCQRLVWQCSTGRERRFGAALQALCQPKQGIWLVSASSCNCLMILGLQA